MDSDHGVFEGWYGPARELFESCILVRRCYIDKAMVLGLCGSL